MGDVSYISFVYLVIRASNVIGLNYPCDNLIKLVNIYVKKHIKFGPNWLIKP